MEAMVDGAARLADDKPWPLSHWRPSVMASQCVAQVNAHLAGVRWDDHGAELPSNVVGVTASAGVPSATRIRLHSPTPSPGQERERAAVSVLGAQDYERRVCALVKRGVRVNADLSC